MKERIYTIPVTDTFKEECECPLCLLEIKLETESIEYMLGPSLMEPDGRTETNKKGFCRRHFELLYNSGINRLGLGLVLDTHIAEQHSNLKKLFEDKMDAIKKESEISFVKNISNKLSSKKTEAEKLAGDVLSMISELESACTVCSRLDFTMERYIDTTLYLWSKEEDFRQLFKSKKGFCLKHFKQLIEGASKQFSTKELAAFLDCLMSMQLENMDRIRQEVSWFTKKFDYRYADEPWGNSKDAVSRSIQKIVGSCSLK